MTNKRFVQEFKQLYGSQDDAELAKRFRISRARVRALAQEHCLRKDKRFQRESGDSSSMPRWTEKEVLWLTKHYASKPNLALARHLNRSCKSVMSKASQLGLRKSATRLVAMGRENKSRQT